MDLTREGVRRWLVDLLARTGDTPTSLARKSGIAQTTLTRFLGDADGDGPMLTLRTISKIAHATGSSPEGFEAPAPDLRQTGFAENDGEPIRAPDAMPSDLREAISALTRGQSAADPWTIKTHALVHAGLLPGDIVIVDLGLTARPGDVVCAQHYSWAQGSAETIFRIYEPPYLVAASSDPELRRPLVVDDERVIIKGVGSVSV